MIIRDIDGMRQNRFDRTSFRVPNTCLKLFFLTNAWFACLAFCNLSLAAETPHTKLEIPSWTTEDFYNAIDQDDAKQVQEYLADSKRASKRFLSYYLLEYALELERTQIVQLMVEAGAGVDTLSAVLYENEQILEEMLKRGVVPLGASLAAERGKVHMVKLLLSYGEDELSTVGAARNGQLETLKLLLEQGAEPDGLELAILNEHGAVAELLLNFGADPNELTLLSHGYFDDIEFPKKYKLEYLSPLHYAVLNKSTDLVNVLLQKGADPNVVPNRITLLKNRYKSNAWPTVLQTAQDSEWGDAEIAQLLLKNDASETMSPNVEESQLELDLYKAAEKWDYDEVMHLLELGAVPTGFGSFFYEMSDRYDPRVIQAFVEAGADPNFFNMNAGGHMYTPTALTLWNGDLENFKRFIQAGAHTSEFLVGWYMKIANNKCSCPIEAKQILLSHSIQRHYRHIYGPYPPAQTPIVQDQLSMGARPKALRYAVTYEHEEIVKLLLEAGADPNELDDDDEQTILELAEETDNLDIVGMLKEAGAHE